MTGESRHRRLEALFLDCVELPPHERAAFLDEHCAGDPELRSQLEDLLLRDARGDDLLPSPLISPTPPLAPRDAAPLPHDLGAYRLGEKLGEGGFGEVYAADQTAPVRRRVAIKILKAGMDSRAVLARFDAERQALALMDHPGIAKVFDAGETETGRSYFVMELVEGVPITTFCEGRHLAARARLELFVSVCRAIEHAHQKGVIHRDLKPSNILVTEVDGQPHPKVIDFGIAKATSAALRPDDVRTLQGELLGTPEYMSPEQATSRGADVDTRTDVYSLGVVLYRLLTGRVPFDAERLRGASIADMQRILLEEEPPKPSESATAETRSKTGSDASTPSASLPPRELRGDLDWIVLRAMEKDRERRYPSAAALAADVERHLGHEPVQASPPTAIYRLRKLARRHRAFVVGATAVFVALVVGIATTATQALRATRAEERARREADVAKSVNAFLAEMLAAANPQVEARGREVSVRELVDRAARKLDETPPELPEVEAGVRHALGSTYVGLGLYEAAEPQLRRAIELRTQHDGAGAASTVESRLRLAEMTSLAGNDVGADSMLQAIDRDAQLSEATDPALHLRWLALRGDALGNLSRLEESDSLCTEVVRLRRELAAAHGNDAASLSALSTALGVLSEIKKKRGSLDAAEPLAREALDVAHQAHSGDHHDTAAAMVRLASVLFQAGKLPEAEALEREAIAMGGRVLGPEHPDVAEWLTILAQMQLEQGRLAEAEATARRALAIVHGKGGTREAVIRDTLATTLQNRGALDDALALRLETLALQREALGDVHESVGSQWNNLGATYRLMKRYADAEHAFAQALDVWRKIYGGEHFNVAITLHNLGKTQLDEGRAEEAERRLREALDLAAKVMPEGHPNRAIFATTHARALAALGRRNEAATELRGAIESLTTALGADHPRTQEAVADLAKLGG